ncbi:MAG: RNA polymerase sigma factor [Candidatus Methylomirabilales bacterium]
MKTRTNEEWLRALRAKGPEQEQALRDLRGRVLRAILAYLAGPHVSQATRSQEDARQLAEECAQEALLAILGKLGTFRGESQFTTWTFAVAVRLLLGKLRRRKWREVSLEDSRIGEELPAWPIASAKSADPERALQQQETWRILRGIIEKDLTQRQRSVLVAHVLQGMPLDLVADWLGTNRDNVYKILHDARKKLKRSLIEQGLTQEEIFAVFESGR